MRLVRTWPVLLAGLLVEGCAPGGRVMVGEDGVNDGDLAAALEVRIASEGVRLVLHITNESARPIQFTFPTSQRYDFWVQDGSGRTVWQWSGDMAFLQVITEATLSPGETWSFDAEWAPGDRTGRHVATGRLTAGERAVQQRVVFELP